MEKKFKDLDLTSLITDRPIAASGIHINPANKGKFTATKKATGKSTEELTHSSNPLTKKRAIFAQNAKKWHHGAAGNEVEPTNDPTYGIPQDHPSWVPYTPLNEQFPNKYPVDFNTIPTGISPKNALDLTAPTSYTGSILAQAGDSAKVGPKVRKPIDTNQVDYALMGGLGLVDQMIPIDNPKPLYARPEEEQVKNLHPYGTNSQAIMDMGGVIPGVTGTMYGRMSSSPTPSSPQSLKKIKGNKAEGGKSIDPTFPKGLAFTPNADKTLSLYTATGKKVGSPINSDQYKKMSASEKIAFVRKMAPLDDYSHYRDNVDPNEEPISATKRTDLETQMESLYRSPKSRTMLKNSLGANDETTQQAINMRLAAMKNTNDVAAPMQLGALGKYDPSTTTVSVANNMELPPIDQKEVYSHEKSHASDKGGSLIPQKDKDLMKSLIITPNKYIQDPSETRARLNSLRLSAKDSGIYDPETQDPTIEMHDKFSKFPAYQDLQKVYGKEGTIQLLKSVSANDSDNTQPIAEYGKSIRPTYTSGGGIDVHWGGGVKQISDNPYDGGTKEFVGDSHEDGGIGMDYQGSPVEVEGGEKAVIDQKGNLNIMGNMIVPGTNQKFKALSKDIAEKELKTNKQQTKAVDLINSVDPTYSFDKFKANTANITMKAADITQRDLSEQKQWLSNLQNAMLDTAKEHGIDPQEMSKGNIKATKAKWGSLVKKAVSGAGVPTKLPSDPNYNKSYQDIISAQNQLNGTAVGDATVTAFRNPKQQFLHNGVVDQTLTADGHIEPTHLDPTSPEVVMPTAPVGATESYGTSKYGNFSNAEKLSPAQLLAESYGLATNRVMPVKAQHYNPDLISPYSISLGDQLNENTASFRGAEKTLGYNASALSTLKGQQYQANEGILGNEFRANQQEVNTVRNQNTQTLNDAKMRNLGIDDQQYTRQETAKSNTRSQNLSILNSVSSKMLQNNLESKRLKAYENMYPNYRFNPETGKTELWNANASINTDGEDGGGAGSGDFASKSTTYDKSGNTIRTKVLQKGAKEENIESSNQAIKAIQANKAKMNQFGKRSSGGKIDIPIVRKMKMFK